MNSPELESVRAKIDRAQHHFDDIHAILKVVLASKPKGEHILINQERERQHLIVTIPNVPPINPALPLMIGDCIHNLRSALDHLVHQLALKNGAPAAAAEKTFFPICLTGAEFDGRVKKLVKPFISDSALTEIKQSQPYSAYDPPAEGTDIWLLHKMDIIDKHRLLIVAGYQMAVSGFVITVPTKQDFHKIIAEPHWKPVKDGAEVIRFDLTDVLAATPGEVHVQVDAMASVLFTNTGLACDGLMVQDSLAQFFGLVWATIGDFGAKFFGE
jgi:hypothetical protein